MRQISQAMQKTILLLMLCSSLAISGEALSAEKNQEDETSAKAYPVKDNPGSIIANLDQAEEKRDYLFQLPGTSGMMQSWAEWKASLYEKYGFRFLIEMAALYQKASTTLGTEDDAAGYDFEFTGTWTFIGKDTPTSSMLGYSVFRKDSLGTDFTPLTLYTQYGSLYPGGTAYGEDEWVVGEFWYQQRIQNKFGFRIGYVFPLTAYDFFPFKNYRTEFVDQNNVANTSIPLPFEGLGGFVQYKPTPQMFFRFGLHDANADPHESGFDTYDGELFSIFEFGMDTNLVPRQKGTPPAGHFHISAWHQDEREDAGISSGKGVTATLNQRFGLFHPFIRYGYADSDADGPTFAKQMASVGFGIENIFPQTKDRFAVSFSWTKPTDDTLNNQNAIDAYYRAQITPQIEFGPTFGVVFDPVNNPEEDSVYVWGLRTRIFL